MIIQSYLLKNLVRKTPSSVIFSLQSYNFSHWYGGEKSKKAYKKLNGKFILSKYLKDDLLYDHTKESLNGGIQAVHYIFWKYKNKKIKKK